MIYVDVTVTLRAVALPDEYAAFLQPMNRRIEELIALRGISQISVTFGPQDGKDVVLMLLAPYSEVHADAVTTVTINPVTPVIPRKAALLYLHNDSPQELAKL